MGWSIEDIEKNLLGGKVSTLALAPDLLVAAANRVERVLGHDWVVSGTQGTGIAPAMQVLGIGLRLAALEGVAGTDKLIEHLRRRDQSAEAELTAIYIIRSKNPSVELQLHPAVGSRKADFRVRRGDEPWITIEVTQPNTSHEELRVQDILHRLTDKFKQTDHPFALEILFSREPTEEEIALLCDRLPEFVKLPGQQHAILANGMGHMFLNDVPIGHGLLHEVPDPADKPMIGLMMFVAGGAGGKVHHQVTIRIPFTDERADKFLRDEARQLPQNGIGLVMINGPSSIKEIKSWTSLIERRFQPRIHTRVSGVCLFGAEVVPTPKGYDCLVRARLLTNQYAQFRLPSWIQSTITSAGQDFELAALEKNLFGAVS